MAQEKRLNIAVLIASRNNAAQLRACIGALDALASGRHGVSYAVACDWDDLQTQALGVLPSFIGTPILLSCKKRRASLGQAWNDAAKAAPAEMYVLVTDRAQCVTPLWDTYIADAYGKDDTRVTWWTTNAGPVIPIVPVKWFCAAGQIYTEYFPFWFDDTWLHELSALVHGLPNYMVQASCFIQKKGSPVTKRMRDLRLWMDFFIAKRPQREAHAARIREALGLPEPDMRPINEWFKSNDANYAENCDKWQVLMGDMNEPDEGYLMLKNQAQEFLHG